ncbi:multiubiquitin domain-containing protein [Flavobacterium plurextorum]|uniref:multiubiquitin domain-containing protein n=1 Tax=Flavobacterium TaxID=237 RepID=UPI00214D33DF|nr:MULTISPECIES: multiubiquitin domain-containing protein [Flavobacterium]UUW08672.1 multiubiquitin domain-containing protein [Flavobacterium plurextorum]
MQHNNKNAGKPVLNFVVNKMSYEWLDQYITGEQIRKIAKIKGDDKLYLQITEPWDDELIFDDTRVNLARLGIEDFYTAAKLKFTVNEKFFDWSEQFINGKQIREIAGIESDDKIFLDNRKPYLDNLIENDEQVDLARPSIERFYTVPVNLNTTIIVSGSPHQWTKPQITFEEVIILAYGSFENNLNVAYTVAYEDGPKQNIEGSLIKGNAVYVKHNMIFHATATDKS